MDEEHHINDLYEDMERLNALYEEMMWPHDVDLEFSADYENNRIIISLKNEKQKRPALCALRIILINLERIGVMRNGYNMHM